MTSIEWTERTWNPTVGCSRVSPGCEHCYAETMAARNVLMSAAQGRESVYLPVVDAERRRWTRKVKLLPERLEQPLRWRKPSRIFVDSMSDLFHEEVPFEFIAAVFGLMLLTPRHTYQVLTKRPQRMREFFAWLDEQADSRPSTAEFCVLSLNDQLRRLPLGSWVAADHLMDVWLWSSRREHGFETDEEDARDVEKRIAKARRNGADVIDAEGWPARNVHLGVSVEDQQRADERIPLLLECPAALRFLSVEPLLGLTDLGLDRWILLKVPVRSEIPGVRMAAGPGVHLAEINPRGAVSVRTAGGLLGVKPAEYDRVGLDWVIVGGESGPGARDCEVAWIRAVVEQCKAASVPVFVKQLGARPVVQRLGTARNQLVVSLKLKSRKGSDPHEWPEDLRVQEMPRIGGASCA